MTLLRYREKTSTCKFPSPTAFGFNKRNSLKGDNIFDILENVYSIHNEDYFPSNFTGSKNSNDNHHDKSNISNNNDNDIALISSSTVVNTSTSDTNHTDVSITTPISSIDLENAHAYLLKEKLITKDYNIDQSINGEENINTSNEKKHSSNIKNNQQLKLNNSIDHKAFHVEWYTTKNSFYHSDLSKEGNDSVFSPMSCILQKKSSPKESLMSF